MTTPKQNIIHHVADTAMHILHGSYLYKTNLWPRRGFKAGWGIGYGDSDTIYYAARTFREDPSNNTGTLVFNLHTVNGNRRCNQITHIKLLLDYTITDDLFFDDVDRKISFIINDDQACFNFTYTPTN